MSMILYSACTCNTGRVRKNNEDNFCFDSRILSENNDGLRWPLIAKNRLGGRIRFAVFDGMGGENFGECASYAAAECMKKIQAGIDGRTVPEEKILGSMCERFNEAVIAKQDELRTERMGSTVVMLSFSRSDVYVCNLGDSRAYRLRDGELIQFSVDHIEKRDGQSSRKAPLTQHLGIRPDDFILEPYIAESPLKRGDWYLLCSDGLTDMLSDDEITAIINSSTATVECAQKLLDAALEKGGRDNTTVIVCRVL